MFHFAHFFLVSRILWGIGAQAVERCLGFVAAEPVGVFYLSAMTPSAT